jgi:chromate transporter
MVNNMWLLFLEFFKIGLFTFGGGYAMIPLLRDAVVNNSWLTLEEFNNFIGVCECTPGPIAVNMATYIGNTVGSNIGGSAFGILGALIATLGVILPAFLIILLIASLLNNFINNKYVQFFLSGIKAVTVSLILGTGITLTLTAIGIEKINKISIFYPSLVCILIVFLLALIYKLIHKKQINTIIFIIISAIIGIAVCSIFEACGYQII